MRYQNIKTKSRYDGKSVYKSVYYPNIYPNVDDLYIIASENDFLDSLSKKYYGTEEYWWIIAQANDLGKGKLSIDTGKRIIIPGNLSRILEDFKRLN
jgi:hypothetical protein